jgi:hypothetical protein
MSDEVKTARNRPLLKIATLAMGSILALMVGESTMRIVQPAATQPYVVNAYRDNERGKFFKYHPTLGWIGKPNVDDTLASPDVVHRVQQNHYGFRGTAYPYQRSDKQRIVVLGDSFVWGFGVENQDLFTTIIEQNTDPLIEVVNLGISGYGTDQQLLMWNIIGQKFNPDHLFLVILPATDCFENITNVAYNYPKPVFRSDAKGQYHLTNTPVPQIPSRAWSNSSEATGQPTAHALGRLAARSALTASLLNALSREPALRRQLEEKSILPFYRLGGQSEPMLYYDPPPLLMQQSWHVTRSLLQTLNQQAIQSKITFTVVVAPSISQTYDNLWDRFTVEKSKPANTQWQRDAPQQQITAFCRQQNIQVIDLLPTLGQASQNHRYLYFRWNGHWTSAGHRIVAKVLTSVLQKTAAHSH